MYYVYKQYIHKANNTKLIFFKIPYSVHVRLVGIAPHLKYNVQCNTHFHIYTQTELYEEKWG